MMGENLDLLLGVDRHFFGFISETYLQFEASDILH